MKKSLNPLTDAEAKKHVSELIFKVLTQKLCVREALKQFPTNINDLSIQCCWHALIHFEADEEYRMNDPEYYDEQVDYLEMIALLLRDGHPVPVNIIQQYQELHGIAALPRSNDFVGIIKSLLRFII